MTAPQVVHTQAHMCFQAHTASKGAIPTAHILLYTVSQECPCEHMLDHPHLLSQNTRVMKATRIQRL